MVNAVALPEVPAAPEAVVPEKVRKPVETLVEKCEKAGLVPFKGHNMKETVAKMRCIALTIEVGDIVDGEVDPANPLSESCLLLWRAAQEAYGRGLILSWYKQRALYT